VRHRQIVILTFLGTRANIALRSRAHQRHSSLLVSSVSGTVVLDRGIDWLAHPYDPTPAGIFVTHAHPDHVGGLRQGAPCPVYATAETWRVMARWPLVTRRIVELYRPITVAGIQVEAWPIEHATTAPAVAYRLTRGSAAILYAPDIARLPHVRRALHGIRAYVGDGSRISRPLTRPRGRVLIGHAAIATQLRWCRAAGVKRAIFTHCGSEIVRGDRAAVERTVRMLGQSLHCRAELAWDGMRVRIAEAHKLLLHAGNGG
jgi:phosphoribosyl 1,2-cyclic phosphodiesterase